MKYTAAFLQNSTELLYCYLIPREHLTFQNETFPRHKKFFWLHNITPKQPTAQQRATTQHCQSLKMETDFRETKKVSKDLHIVTCKVVHFQSLIWKKIRLNFSQSRHEAKTILSLRPCIQFCSLLLSIISHGNMEHKIDLFASVTQK